MRQKEKRLSRTVGNIQSNGNLAGPGSQELELTHRKSERRKVEGLFLFSTYRFVSGSSVRAVGLCLGFGRAAAPSTAQVNNNDGKTMNTDYNDDDDNDSNCACRVGKKTGASVRTKMMDGRPGYFERDVVR